MCGEVGQEWLRKGMEGERWAAEGDSRTIIVDEDGGASDSWRKAEEGSAIRSHKHACGSSTHRQS